MGWFEIGRASGIAGLEFSGFFGVPLRVAINKSASYGYRWDRIGYAVFLMKHLVSLIR